MKPLKTLHSKAVGVSRLSLLTAVFWSDRDAAERKLRDALTEYLNAGVGPLGIGDAK